MSSTASSGKFVSILVPVELQEALQAFLNSYQQAPKDLSNPQQLHAVEQQLASAADLLFSAAMQPVVQQSVAAREPTKLHRSWLVPSWLRLLAAPAKPLKNQGRRTVHVRLSRGPAISLGVVYYSRNCDRDDPGAGQGCYPALQCLGIFDRCSPVLVSQAAQTVALCGSFAEARYMLQLQGVVLNVKTLAKLVYRFAARARENLRRVGYPLPSGTSAEGLRLVVALDGGRTRLRHNKAGKRRKSGRHGYHAPWREPKLLTIYAIDDKGKKLKTFAAIMDGTFELLADSEEIFIRLQSYLKGLAVEKTHEVIFIGDGAPWVSNRVPKLVKELKIAEEKVRVVVDFYHAVEHLKAVADGHKQFAETERKAWIKKQRKRLYNGGVAKVIKEMEELKGEKVQTEKEYFANRQKQMQYAALKKAGVPIGSGAVENAMRRIVNLRLKGNGIFWREANAEHVLLLRCYAKAGRWPNLLPLALRSSLLPAA